MPIAMHGARMADMLRCWPRSFVHHLFVIVNVYSRNRLSFSCCFSFSGIRPGQQVDTTFGEARLIELEDCLNEPYAVCIPKMFHTASRLVREGYELRLVVVLSFVLLILLFLMRLLF